MIKINETYQQLIQESSEKIWYHGTPDVKDLELDGGFGEQTLSVEIIKDIDAYANVMSKMERARESKDEDLYFKILDSIPSYKDYFKMKKPFFLTNVLSVAKTYADPNRAFDYQNAKEKIFKVESDPGKNIVIDGRGARFRFIDVSGVKSGFTNSGITSDDFDRALAKFNFMLRDKTKIKTDMIAALGNFFGVDTIDVKNVLDSYNGGTKQSTVRMVLNTNLIKLT